MFRCPSGFIVGSCVLINGGKCGEALCCVCAAAIALLPCGCAEEKSCSERKTVVCGNICLLRHSEGRYAKQLPNEETSQFQYVCQLDTEEEMQVLRPDYPQGGQASPETTYHPTPNLQLPPNERNDHEQAIVRIM